MSRFHSNKNGVAWAGEKVRYFLNPTAFGGPDVVKVGGPELSRWLGINGSDHWNGQGSEYFEANPLFLEVQEADLPYLKKPEGDWEFRRAIKGDVALRWSSKGHGRPDIVVLEEDNRSLKCHRWCRPKKIEAKKVETTKPLHLKSYDGMTAVLGISDGSCWDLCFPSQCDANEFVAWVNRAK